MKGLINLNRIFNTLETVSGGRMKRLVVHTVFL